MKKQKNLKCYEVVKTFLIARWNFLLFLVNSDFLLFTEWWIEQKVKPEPSQEGCDACYNALQRIFDVSQKLADKKETKDLCDKIGHGPTIRKAMLSFCLLEEAFRNLEEEQYDAALSNTLEAHNEFLIFHFQRAIESKKDGKISDTAFGVKRLFDAILKDMKDEREKKVFVPGRLKGTKTRQDTATKNWKTIDKAIEDFFISGEGFRRDCTNMKITGVVFESVGKNLHYSEKTIAQRVKSRAPEYRKKHASHASLLG